MVMRQEATTATSKLQAAKEEEETIQFTDFFCEANTTMVTNIVAEIPPKKALTKDNCSATATMYVGLSSVISRPFQFSSKSPFIAIYS